jgi:hypothetical protein
MDNTMAFKTSLLRHFPVDGIFDGVTVESQVKAEKPGKCPILINSLIPTVAIQPRTRMSFGKCQGATGKDFALRGSPVAKQDIRLEVEPW